MATFTDLASGLTAQRRKTRLKGRKSTIRGVQSPLSNPPGSLTSSAEALAELKEEELQPTFNETVQPPPIQAPPPKPVALPSAGPAGGPAQQLAAQKMEAELGPGLGSPGPTGPQPTMAMADAVGRGGMSALEAGRRGASHLLSVFSNPVTPFTSTYHQGKAFEDAARGKANLAKAEQGPFSWGPVDAEIGGIGTLSAPPPAPAGTPGQVGGTMGASALGAGTPGLGTIGGPPGAAPSGTPGAVGGTMGSSAAGAGVGGGGK